MTPVAVLAACLAMLACGSDDGRGSADAQTGEEAAVAATVKRYLTAMGTLNPVGVCGSLTAAGQRDLVRQSGATKRSCEEVLRLGFGLLNDQQKQDLAQQAALQPYQIVVDGPYATGQLQFRGQVSQFQARKVNGVWRLSSPGDRQLTPG